MNENEPIRVLQVVTWMNRNGYENRIMDIYRNIDRDKIQFDFLTHRMVKGQFDDEIEKLGGKIYYFPALRPQSLPSYMKKLKKFFTEHNYLIVHAHLNANCTWVLQAAKEAGVPVRIAHSRNSGMDHDWKAVFKFVSKQFVNLPATHKFACSRQAGEWLFGEKGISEPNYFRVIPNGFDLTKFVYSQEKRDEIRANLGIKPNEFVVVHVGRITHQKNHSFLIDIYAEIKKRVPKSKLVLMGNGNLGDEISNKVNALGLSESVLFLGNIENVGDYLSAMDVMIFPSIYEGFGTAVLETQCNGMPTLSSDVLPKETKITVCEEFLSIKKDPPQKWAEKAIEMFKTIPRIDRSNEVKNAGYDIKDTYKMLSDFYLEQARLVERSST